MTNTPEERPVTRPAETVIIHVPEQTSLNGKPVPQEVVDGLIELRLKGMTVTAVANELGLNKDTVELHWKRYLRERAAQRVEDTTVAFAELIERLNQNALDARAGYYRTIASEHAHAESNGVKYLAAERQALDSLARIGVERDDAPAQAARIQAAQATVMAGLIREVVNASGLSADDKARLFADFSIAMRAISEQPEPVVVTDLREVHGE